MDLSRRCWTHYVWSRTSTAFLGCFAVSGPGRLAVADRTTVDPKLSSKSTSGYVWPSLKSGFKSRDADLDLDLQPSKFLHNDALCLLSAAGGGSVSSPEPRSSSDLDIKTLLQVQRPGSENLLRPVGFWRPGGGTSPFVK